MPRIGKDIVELTAVQTLIYTVPVNTQTSLIEMVFLNRDTVDRQVTVHFVPNGGSATNANKVLEHASGNALQPGHTEVYRFNQVLNAGDEIRWFASAASIVNARLSVFEEAV